MRLFLLILFVSLYGITLSANSLQLISTESDPDAFVQNCVNVINGDYCEVSTDLSIVGPDVLVLQRFYSNDLGSWKILPQRFLVVGKEISGKSCVIGNERFDRTLALTGERSGGVLPYTGWRNPNGITKDPLKIDILNQAIGMVNTYVKEINGQTNHQNNQLHCKGDTCELTLGDGTRRVYKQVKNLPSSFLGEELTPLMAKQILDPTYFLLIEETLPSGNKLFFSYDDGLHLVALEMKNSLCNKILSWLHFSYETNNKETTVHIQTSEERTLNYHYAANQLIYVNGTHFIPISYEYNNKLLVKKILPGGRFIEIAYQNGRVQALQGPHAMSGSAETLYSFYYSKDSTDVFDAMGIKTRYISDKRSQLITIERYDNQNRLYRLERKFWGKTKADAGLLLAKSIGDGEGRTYSYRSFSYDKSANVIEERLYGNLTGKKESFLQILPDGKLSSLDEEECHLKTFGYSTDGFNLLTKVGDCKEHQTLYYYKPGTNLLLKKFIYDKSSLRKRLFQQYNEDGVCIKVIDDDGSCEEESRINGYGVTERHIKEIKPKINLPGIGLPEVIEEKSFDLTTNKELLVKKLINTYDSQGNLLSCDTFDSNGDYSFTEKRAYDLLGRVIFQCDAIGRETFFTYDEAGNEVARFSPYENKQIHLSYDFNNKLIHTTEITNEEQINLYNHYDQFGRKIASTDRFGQTTHYEYDFLHRVIKIAHPEVLGENGDVKRPTFFYNYDIFGNVLLITDAKGFTTTKSYNLRGDPTKISYPDGSYELFKYDTEGSLHRSLNRDQIITVYEYDYVGRLIQEESSILEERGTHSFLRNKSYQYNGFRCIYEKDCDHIKEYTFDPAGRLKSISEHASNQNKLSPEARVTEFTYDSYGRTQQRKIWFDKGPQDYSLEFYSYDLAGNVIEKQIKDSANTVLLEKHYIYNLKGQCEEEYTYYDGIKTSLFKILYNSEGEPICYIDGVGQKTTIIIDNNFRNDLGQIVVKKTLVNPLGVQTNMEFDALGRLYSIHKKGPNGVLLSSQKNFYDEVGNKTKEIHDQVVEGRAINSQITRWSYGPMGRVEEEIQAADSAAAKSTHYKYNSIGKLISKNLSGNLIQYTTEHGMLKSIESRNNKNERQTFNTYSYDANGNIYFACTVHHQMVDRRHNVFKQITTETIRDGEGSYTSSYEYDRKGRLKTVILPDLSKIIYKYDGVFGREVHRVSASGNTLYTHHYEKYDTQGKLLLENHIGYVGNSEYSYNLNGQKITCQNDYNNQEYSRDEVGRIVAIKNEVPQYYTYNHLSQLTSEKKIVTKTYSYDSLDNRTKNDDEKFVYNALNQLLSCTNTEFSYDLQGSLTKKVANGKTTQFESNLLSQLISLKTEDLTSLAFSYDPFGRLTVEKELDLKGNAKKTLSTKRYMYLGYQEIGTLHSTGAIENLKILGLHGDELATTSIAFEIKGAPYVPLHDIAGNVTHLIDPESLQIVERYEYTAFGQISIFNVENEEEVTSPIGNPWQFAEKRIHEKSGLIFFGLRFYDPSIGRWISQDPASFVDGPNLYAYLRNNPLNNHDRLGLNTEANAQSKFDEYFYGEIETHCFCEKHRTCKRGGDIGKTSGFHLPKVTHDEYFEKYYRDYRNQELLIKDCYDNSTHYDLIEDGLPNLPNDLGIGFINGIWNNFNSSKASTRYISTLAGGYNIHAVYNASHGTGVDVGECGLGLFYVATEPVRQLHLMWNNFFEKNSLSAKFLMICHSQGAIHVRNALLDYPSELRERILVVAIAPGGYIYQETCAKVVHYRVDWWRDFVPRLDILGVAREKDSIVNLRSHSKAAPFDHEFMSLTYKEVIAQHIRNYIDTQGNKF